MVWEDAVKLMVTGPCDLVTRLIGGVVVLVGCVLVGMPGVWVVGWVV